MFIGGSLVFNFDLILSVCFQTKGLLRVGVNELIGIEASDYKKWNLKMKGIELKDGDS